MDNQHSQALMSIPPTRFSPPTPQPRTKRQPVAIAHLTHNLMQALQTDCPLRQMAGELGHYFASHACLLLGHHLESGTVTLAIWRPDSEARLWNLSAAFTPETTPFNRQQAIDLIGLLVDAPETSSGLSSLKSFLAMQEVRPWLSQIEAYQLIPVQAPGARGVAVLLGQSGFEQQQHLPSQSPSMIAELASLLAIAFRQEYLHQQAQRSIEQLRYINNLKDDFINTLSHELRTPLTSMMLAIRMLKRSDLTPERQAMYLEILEQQCARETSLVNDLLSLQSLETARDKAVLSAVNLNQLVKGLVDTQRSQFADSRLDLQLDLPQRWITIETEMGHLTRVFEELLTNARKYAEPGSQVVITVKAGQSATEPVTIQLTNIGVGITPEELPHIFDKFRRGEGVTQRAIPGTGMGLALVKGLVKQLKGTVTVTSQPCETAMSHWRTCVTLSLPCYVSRPLAVG